MSWEKLSERTEGVPFIEIKWQHGPVKEVGVNGCQVEDVLFQCLERLKALNSISACRENSLAITKVQEGMMWLNERTRERESRGVEGFNIA